MSVKTKLLYERYRQLDSIELFPEMVLPSFLRSAFQPVH